jgi:hypothetical protein
MNFHGWETAGSNCLQLKKQSIFQDISIIIGMAKRYVRLVVDTNRHTRLPFQLFYSNLFNIGKGTSEQGRVHDKNQDGSSVHPYRIAGPGDNPPIY